VEWNELGIDPEEHQGVLALLVGVFQKVEGALLIA
jgi:hypothetical protein